jgi:putative transposase
MAKTEHYHTQFEEGRYYHIYNRTIDKGKLFANEGNYIFFLKKLVVL